MFNVARMKEIANHSVTLPPSAMSKKTTGLAGFSSLSFMLAAALADIRGICLPCLNQISSGKICNLWWCDGLVTLIEFGLEHLRVKPC